MVLLLHVVPLGFLLGVLVLGLCSAGGVGVLPVGRGQLLLRLVWLRLPWLGFPLGSDPENAGTQNISNFTLTLQEA